MPAGSRCAARSSAELGVPLEQLALGNGSNDLLYQLVLATCEPTDEVLSHQLRVPVVPAAPRRSRGGRSSRRATTTDLACDVDALIAAITPRTKLVVLGSPNNPTGSVVTRADAERVLAALPQRALLVIDEAYAEYAAQWPEVDHVDGLALQKQDTRVVVLRTFSKIYGLAGLRVGFARRRPRGDRCARIASGARSTCRRLAMVGAIAALDDHEHVAISAKHARAAIEQHARARCTGPAYASIRRSRTSC